MSGPPFGHASDVSNAAPPSVGPSRDRKRVPSPFEHKANRVKGSFPPKADTTDAGRFPSPRPERFESLLIESGKLLEDAHRLRVPLNLLDETLLMGLIQVPDAVD